MAVRQRALDARKRALGVWARLVDPAAWSWRRVVVEAVLACVLAAVTGFAEYLDERGWVAAVLASFAVAVLSLVRRVLPATVLVASAALSGMSAGGSLLLLMVASWSAGRRIDAVLRALGAYAAAFAIYELSTLREVRPLSVESVLVTLLFLVFTIVPGLTGRYWEQRRTLVRTLEERHLQLLREREMVAGQARMRERQRIARDMHDSLGHQLALIAVQTGALEVSRGLSDQQREAVGVLREASVTAMRELRAVVGVLRDGTVEDGTAAEEGPASRVVAGIGRLVESAAAAGVRARFDCSGEPRPPAPAADHAAYRVVQEGLTNAYKHAPGAEIAVSLRYEPDSLVVEVANGPVPLSGEVRPPAVSGGQGLTGLRERARLAGGIVHAGPVEGGGFRLAGVFPYDAGDGAEGGAAREAARAATFVGTEDDFRWQLAAAPPGDGGPVYEWLDPREELKSVMSLRKNNGCLIGCFAVLVLLAIGVVLVVLAIGKVVDEADKAAIDRKTYDAIRVGTAEDTVREELPSGKSFLTDDVKGKGPAEPAGSQCLSLLSKDGSGDARTDHVFRFCFKDGKLIEKRDFNVPSF
ncbi:histidine kinase [Streptomyces sp. UNOC14_S4]|uniref:histidine kinase n=1 Tax=Streptomyces sp. UNOC14_S4 TaxID=2872340 RepID=UPI001E2F9E1E|nr:histidine kinase [Streptomyces sp. UNOC14_S4]MCC3772472.1 sensor histidine kinase [Streptomyces sp. UNOC14_S4]